MSIYDYKDPIITRTRKGTSDDPYVDKEEWFRVERGRVILTELPCEFNRVTVTGGNKTWVEKMSGVPKENEYVVDYTNKIVHFHPSNDGLDLKFSYVGRGMAFVPTSMIYTKTDGYDVLETLQDVIDDVESVIDIGRNFMHRGEYSSDEEYHFRNIVKYKNATYICINPEPSGISGSIPSKDSEDWHLLTNILSPKNVYSESITYNMGDIIRSKDNLTVYLSLKDDNLNNELSNENYWMTLIDLREVINTIESQERIRQENEDERQEKISNLISVGDYDSDTLYKPRNIVYYKGSSYMCIKECKNILPINEEYWGKIADRGQKGSDGLNLAFKGVFDEKVTYSEYDLVRYNGALYMAKQQTVGNPPTNEDFWTLYLEDGSNKVVCYPSTKIINSETDKVEIGVEQYNKELDTLLVFKNSTYIHKDKDYVVDQDSRSIININGLWEASEEIPIEFNFIVLKNVVQDVDSLHGNMIEDETITDKKLHKNIKIGDLNNIDGRIISDLLVKDKQVNVVNLINYLIEYSNSNDVSTNYGSIATGKQVQYRRGTTEDHEGFIGAEGELTVDTTKNTVVVHDGKTQGGISLAKENDTYKKFTERNMKQGFPVGKNVKHKIEDVFKWNYKLEQSVLYMLDFILYNNGVETLKITIDHQTIDHKDIDNIVNDFKLVLNTDTKISNINFGDEFSFQLKNGEFTIYRNGVSIHTTFIPTDNLEIEYNLVSSPQDETAILSTLSYEDDIIVENIKEYIDKKTIDNKNNIDFLQNNISNLQNEVSDIDAKVSDNTTDISNIQNEIDTHITNSDIHVTSQERNTWNNKQDKLGYTPVNKAGDTFTGIAKAHSNTSYTVAQIRNIILSPNNPSGGNNGDIWIKYK